MHHLKTEVTDTPCESKPQGSLLIPLSDTTTPDSPVTHLLNTVYEHQGLYSVRFHLQNILEVTELRVMENSCGVAGVRDARDDRQIFLLQWNSPASQLHPKKKYMQKLVNSA